MDVMNVMEMVDIRPLLPATVGAPAGLRRRRRGRLGIARWLAPLLLAVGFTAVPAAPVAAAQPVPDTARPAPAVPGSTLARFDRATAVAVDPQGRLYVSDAQRSAVVILDPDGSLRGTLGGPGTRTGQFADPAGLDPTNGLALWVADAGNGRLQQFSADGQFLEALPLGLQDDGTSSRQQQPVFDATRNGVAPLAEGEPIAVATTPANELFAIDARRSVVVKWDAQRRPERVIGGFGQRRGRLQHPVDLALDANRLYVADRERASILVYDLLGTYRRSIRLSDRTRLAAARGLAVDSGRLWIATGSQVVTVSTGAVGQRVAAEIDAPIVDLAVRRPDLYVLTESRLLRLAGAARTTADD